jgi:hypothetical protein
VVYGYFRVSTRIGASPAQNNHRWERVKLPVNTQLGTYCNVVTPDNDPNWQIRVQVQFMFLNNNQAGFSDQCWRIS